MLFPVTEAQLAALKASDKRLAQLIEQTGPVERTIFEDLFTCIVCQIVSQQISSSALKTVWSRFEERFGKKIEPAAIVDAGRDAIAHLGISNRKAKTIELLAQNVIEGTFDLEKLRKAENELAKEMLVARKGIGPWTAEMILLFGLQRTDILSFSDFGIRKGLCLLYQLDDLSRNQFEKYRSRFSPNGSIASFYLWKLANGEVQIRPPFFS